MLVVQGVVPLHEAEEVSTSALRLLAAAAGAPGSPFTESTPVADRLVQTHFLAFARLLAAPAAAAAPPPLCRLHLQVWPLLLGPQTESV